MDPVAIVRPADDLLTLAAQINAEHEAGEMAVRERLQRSRTVGSLLLAAKARCGHGQWLPWLKKNVRFSQSRARHYMQFVKTLVTSDLADAETEWQRISGNAHPRPDDRKPTHAVPSDDSPCCTVNDLSRLVANGKRFGCIYADPPWQYGNQATRAATDNHYPTMTVDEIAALPVGELAAPESHLWLWTTNGFLFDCPRLFAAWGFEFKSSYVWVKPQMGIGNYLRNSHELLLLAVRGGLVGAATNVKSWGEFDRAAHSAKPERIRTEVIERTSPGPYLELFGRKVAPGWSVWGNEVKRGSLFDPEVKESA